MDKEADKVIRELGDAWADVERWKKKAAEWERISDQMEHRLMQIADIVKHIKTADGFDPVCSNEIVAAVEKLRAEVEKLTRERDEARAELSRCKQAHSAAEDDVESLREQFETMSRHADQQRLQIEKLSKAPLSRLDEFAKAALTGLLSDPERNGDIEDFAAYAVEFAQATIRALDGAGGAS